MRGPKPEKPRPDFPLTAFASGVWGKKIRGKIYYFGGWSNPAAAETEYLRQKEHLQADRTPPPRNDTRLTLLELSNQFMDAKQTRVELGKMKPGQLIDYKRSCTRVLKCLGNATVVESLEPKDFDNLSKHLKKNVGSVTFANRVRLARGLFKFADDRGLITKKLIFGENFVLPDATELRKQEQARGEIDFTAEEIRAILGKAKSPLKTMILLGANGGFGNNDCATLPMAAINFDKSMIDFPRPKTAIPRKCPLWPETIAALRESIADRYEPHDPQLANLVFITKYGNAYVRMNEKGVNFDSIAMEFAKILKDLGLKGRRRGFYSLRRTFQTIGEEPGDLIAVQAIMGHGADARDMSAKYRQRISDDRLKAVTDYVHTWLWPNVKKTDKKKSGKSKAKQ